MREVIRLGDSGGDGKIGLHILVPHPPEPLGKPPFVCVGRCVPVTYPRKPTYTLMYSLCGRNILQNYLQVIQPLDMRLMHGAACRARRHDNRGTLWPWHVFILPLPRLHFATRECVSAGDLGSLHRFFPTFRREDRAAVEHTVGGCLRGGERQMGKLISLQHQVWKLMVRDWLGHFGGEYLIHVQSVSHCGY